MEIVTFILMLPAFLGLQGDIAPIPPERARIQVDLSGEADFAYYYRDGALSESIRNMNAGLLGISGAGKVQSDNGMRGQFVLSLNVQVSDRARVVFEIRNEILEGDANGNGVIDSGDNLALGRDSASLNFSKAYVVIDRFLFDPVTADIGLINLSYRLRPHGEVFFLDPTNAESFFSSNTSGSAERNMVTRDQLDAVGMKARWDTLGWAVDVFNVLISEKGGAQDDETLTGIFAEVRPRLNLSIFALATLSNGEQSGAHVGSAGGGVDYHVTDYLELFAEAYTNFGTYRDKHSVSPSKITKKGAFGLEGGVRVTFDDFWTEMSYWQLSGDKDPSDSEDNSFQSYENVNQFLILEGSEFGMDIDTNYIATKFSIGLNPFSLGNARKSIMSMQLDAGLFEFDQDLYSPSSVKYFKKGGNDLGKEVDFTVKVEYGKSVTFSLKLAHLYNSDFLSSTTADKNKSLSMILAGFRTSF